MRTVKISEILSLRVREGRGGGYSLIWPYRYVRPQRVGFFDSAILVINRVWF